MIRIFSTLSKGNDPVTGFSNPSSKCSFGCTGTDGRKIKTKVVKCACSSDANNQRQCKWMIGKRDFSATKKNGDLIFPEFNGIVADVQCQASV